MPKFQNPYLGSTEPTKYLSARVPESAYNHIKMCRLLTGTIQNTTLILWKKLEDELRKRNITGPIDHDRFEEFLLNSVLILPSEYGSIIEPNPGGASIRGVAPSGSNIPAGGGNDGGPASSQGSNMAGKKAKRADAKSGTRKGGVGKNRKQEA